MSDDVTQLPEEFRRVARPVQQALAFNGLHTFEAIAAKSERELLALHGIGPKGIRQLREVLATRGMHLARDEE